MVYLISLRRRCPNVSSVEKEKPALNPTDQTIYHMMISNRALRSSTRGFSESRKIHLNVAPPKSPLKRRPSRKRSHEETQSTETLAEKETPVSTPKKAKSNHASPSILLRSDLERSVMNAGFSTGDMDDATPPPDLVDRPAGPHRTNAPLASSTPGGSRLVSYSTDSIDASPSKTELSRPTTTTSHLLEQACSHLIRADARLKPVIERHRCHLFSSEGLSEVIDPFRSLSSGIMAQQVSGAATKSIKNKFVGLFNKELVGGEAAERGFPTPAQVAACEVSFLRQAGLSQRKAEYIKGLAEKFVCGELSADMLIKASDDEVLEKLTAVRGLGRWSVEMFACFGLKRMDVFSTGDLGVQYDPLILHHFKHSSIRHS